MAIQAGDPVHPLSHHGIALYAPAKSGTYAICDGNGVYIYFGESKDVQRRLSEHLNDPYDLIHVYGAVSFTYELYETELERVLRQNALILAFPTPCNQRLG